MSIAETQRALIREKILQENLRKGIYPNVGLVNQLEEAAFKTTMAGLPRFTYRPMAPHQSSSSNDYNNMINEIFTDLSVGFEEIKRINNKIMSLSHYYETNRTKINSMTKEIELKVNALSLKTEYTTHSEVFGDDFSNFLRINFKEDSRRNIPKTTAFIDLLNGSVEMKRQKKSTKQHDISDASIKFSAKNAQRKIETSTIKNVLNDTVDNHWQTIVVSSSEITMVGELDVSLQSIVKTTSISFDSQVGKPIFVTLYISADGKEFTQLEEAKIISSYKWEMEARDVQYLKFVMEKREEDRVNGSEFEYVFGGRNIKIVEDLYEDYCYFVSTPYDVKNHEAIRQIILEADHSIPANTSIQYYVGFDYGNNSIEWQEIENNKTITTNMVKESTMNITPDTVGYGSLDEVKYSAEFYRIASIPHTPIKGSVHALKGRNVWLKEMIPAPFIYEKTDDESDSLIYPTGLHDWVRAGTSKKSYVHIQSGFDYLRKDYFHRYTVHIRAEKDVVHDATFSGGKDTSQAVYVNNMEVTSINKKYTLILKKGWNKIEVYVYARAVNEEINLDFYLPDMNYEVFSDAKPLEEVSLYELKNNTSVRDHNKIAIDEDNNLIVNYNPQSYQVVERNQISEIASSISGLEYVLRYNYSTSSKTLHSIRFMAILQKKTSSIQATPRILGYKLIVE